MSVRVCRVQAVAIRAAVVFGLLLQATGAIGQTVEQHPANCDGIANRAYRLCTAASSLFIEQVCRLQESQTLEDCKALRPAARPPVVVVNADGTFFPKHVTIKSGETVLWSFSERTDTIIPIIPIPDPLPINLNLCTAYKPYVHTDPNEFTGPMPRAPGGIFILNPKDPPFTIQAALWTKDFTGVFIRLPWKAVHLGPGEFDWTALDDQMNKAVQHGKLFSLVFKASKNGTPDWIFARTKVGADAAKALNFRDGGSSPGQCGSYMTLGSPADPNYRTHYFALLKAVADHIKSRNAWYRALAYIKPSGANLITAENRLPQRCWFPTESKLVGDKCDCTLRNPGEPARRGQCICNPQVWATQGGYTPAAILEFYSLQTALLAREFPNKDMSYMLIQDGFPKTNNAGEYDRQNVVNPAGEYVLPTLTPPGPGGTIKPPVDLPKTLFAFPLKTSGLQLNAILEQGATEHGFRFVVQHNGLRAKPQLDGQAACTQEGTHPIRPATELDNRGPCPNTYVLRAGARNGSITGFQTTNDSVITSHERLGSALLNAYDNTDAIFVETYEGMFHQWENEVLEGRTFKQWADRFHERRRNFFRDKAPDPFPYVHGHRFHRTVRGGNTQQVVRYVHGTKCDPANPHIASITINAE